MRHLSTYFWTALLTALLVGAPSVAVAEDGDDEAVLDDEEADEAAEEQRPTSSLQRGGRMEFDARLIRGERAGTGAVFLFQRPPRPLPSMIDRRTSYLDGTVYSVLGDEGVERLRQNREEE